MATVDTEECNYQSGDSLVLSPLILIIMNRVSFTQFDTYPEAMIVYMKNYGPHFNRKLYEFAVSRMTKKVGQTERKIEPYTKEMVENLKKQYGVIIKNGQLYDEAYVACMCKADFLGSSVIDEQHLIMHVKDVVDDIDAPDGLLFNRWYADTCYMGIAIDWEEMV